MNGTVAARVPAKDLPAFRAFVGGVLNNSTDRSTSTWTSSPGSSRHPVQVAITPLQTSQTQKASTCRLLDANVSHLNVSEKWQFWFCKQADGRWKSSGTSSPR